MSLHNRIIDEILQNRCMLEAIVELYDTTIQANVSMGSFGDIDIKITGTDYLTQEERIAIIEVKSHDGLVPHYVKFQLPKYMFAFPGAKQFVVYSTGDSNFEEFVFENHTI